MGFWDKVKGFFKKIGTGIKTVFQKVAPVVKTVLPFLAPIIPGGPATTEVIRKGIDIGEKFLGARNSIDDGGTLEQKRELLEKVKRGPFGSAFGGNVSLDSPRIRLK